ncbi:Hypothetical protein FNO222_1539 [Francisella orientalis]|uniref:Uncharacterized protein n=1 Tax=Francisella orientalis TaxID=299583 RepID=A0ABM5U7J7_9GAMM|nr:hypothetical protein FNO12_1525 [Francisella orientalis FNO12]AKN87611.1 Hypothetical protein FNO24_1527 [Francisella orientalis FNO24]AKN89149.1 Hypothetical protein FNO190_1525 [Francisella orientalis]AKU05908.1 Hypothetical protein FNO01_1525 [Francisella orientalis]QEN20825.1 Hypothetical protein FNO39_1539 [Francisella orientalis]
MQLFISRQNISLQLKNTFDHF